MSHKPVCSISSFAVCRVPAYPYDQEPGPVWEELKVFIENASPEFFTSISQLTYAEIEAIGGKTFATFNKYFNRARFRATPFGFFASFCSLKLVDENSHPHLRLSTPIYHSFINWGLKDDIYRTLQKKRHARQIVVNSSAYSTGSKLKYLYFQDGRFELSSIEKNSVLVDLVQFCREQRPATEAIAYLCERCGMERAGARALIKQLTREQLLHTSDWMNITGEDYFTRVGATALSKQVPYIISERSALNGSVGKQRFDVLREAADFLNKHLPFASNRDLENFKKKFVFRYEGREIPLSLALDPQLGVGYGDLAQLVDSALLVKDLLQLTKPGENRLIKESELYTYILNCMISQQDVRLEKFESKETFIVPLPNTFSAILHNLPDGNIQVQHFGGCTANSLLGRFSMASSEIEQATREFAAFESRANPEVMFFDVAYQSEGVVDNINRRKHIYDAELPIAVWSTSKRRLMLDEIMVCVIDDEIVLRLAGSKKRMVPRISSAYNSSRAELSHFRFLSDLQYQGIRSTLLPNFTTIFKGLSRYPRILYKNIVLSPEIHMLPDEFTQGPVSASEECLKVLQNWFNGLGITFFKYGDGDQTLLFDSSSATSLMSFISVYRPTLGVYIEETTLFEKDEIKDQQNASYLGEFIISLCHPRTIYRPTPQRSIETDRVYHLPGSEWLYAQIYCHPVEADRLVVEIFGNLIRKNRGIIQLWFFVRYDQPNFHIRLRIKSFNYAELIQKIRLLLTPHMADGTINDYNISTYFPEVERYGLKRMRLSENFFYRNSVQVLALLKEKRSVVDRYAESALFFSELLDSIGYSTPQKIQFIKVMVEAYRDEFNFSHSGFKLINKYSKNVSERISELRTLRCGDKRLSIKAFLQVVKCHPATDFKIIADLFHMHVNRLFAYQQRMHELVIYVLLENYVKSQEHRKGKEQPHQ